MDSFIEYMLFNILEMAQGEDELPVYFSDSFREIIKEIEEETGNEVAGRLLWEEGKKSKRVYVDIDQDSIDKVSFLMANKAEEILGRKDNLKYLSPDDYDSIWKARQRGTMKINRFINTLFNNEYETKQLTPQEREYNRDNNIKLPSQHLEDFVNQFKAIREPGQFQIVKGGEVPYWYSEDQYYGEEGTLGGSCMKYEECQEYLDFYEYNQHKISMLIMKSKKTQSSIIGRALIWKLDTPSGRTFMDRIYTNYDHDVENFKKYAKDNGWLYKDRQNMEASERIVDPVNSLTDRITLVVKDISSDEYEYFPYLDTLKYYAPKLKIISNKLEAIPQGSKIFKLEGTEGTDFYKINNRSIEDLREMFKDDIINDIKYYAVEMYPNLFWDHIDNNRYVQAYIDGEVEYYVDDFEYILTDEEELIKYIKSNSDDNDLPDNIDEMEISELHELVDDLNIRGEIAREYAEERYKDYTAEEIFEELYGLKNGINNDIFDQLEYYFDEDGFAEEAANNEDESYLRDRYPDDDE